MMANYPGMLQERVNCHLWLLQSRGSGESCTACNTLYSFTTLHKQIHIRIINHNLQENAQTIAFPLGGYSGKLACQKPWRLLLACGMQGEEGVCEHVALSSLLISLVLSYFRTILQWAALLKAIWLIMVEKCFLGDQGGLSAFQRLCHK